MIRSPRSIAKFLALAAAAALIAVAPFAFAGAPLKGVGVSLGKSPGGGCATRTTGGDGTADFGVWPKGNYTLVFTQPPLHPGEPASGMATGRVAAPAASTTASKLHVVISGAASGKLERDIDAGQATERAVPLEFSLDGKQKLVVVISTAD